MLQSCSTWEDHVLTKCFYRCSCSVFVVFHCPSVKTSRSTCVMLVDTCCHKCSVPAWMYERGTVAVNVITDLLTRWWRGLGPVMSVTHEHAGDKNCNPIIKLSDIKMDVTSPLEIRMLPSWNGDAICSQSLCSCDQCMDPSLKQQALLSAVCHILFGEKELTQSVRCWAVYCIWSIFIQRKGAEFSEEVGGRVWNLRTKNGSRF